MYNGIIKALTSVPKKVKTLNDKSFVGRYSLKQYASTLLLYIMV